MQDTCKIHRIHILITNPPKFDNKPPVTPHGWAALGHSAQFSALKFAHDGAGGKIVRKINVCDHTGKVP